MDSPMPPLRSFAQAPDLDTVLSISRSSIARLSPGEHLLIVVERGDVLRFRYRAEAASEIKETLQSLAPIRRAALVGELTIDAAGFDSLHIEVPAVGRAMLLAHGCWESASPRWSEGAPRESANTLDAVMLHAWATRYGEASQSIH